MGHGKPGRLRAGDELVCTEQGGFICTVRDGFAFLDLTTGNLEPIVMAEADLPGNRFNDGKVDGNGRYWAGTMDDDGELETGSLYRLDKDFVCAQNGRKLHDRQWPNL